MENETEKERACAFYGVAELLAENGQDENEAAMLDRFFSATQEKIADELNHAQSLLREYTELTGILPAEE